MTRPSCHYCSRPKFAGGQAAPLCELHFDLWLMISRLKNIGLPATIETIQAELICLNATGRSVSFTLAEISELLAQLAPELPA